MDELVILRGPDSQRVRARIEQKLRVTHEATPRVFVVSGEPGEIEALSRDPDVYFAEALSKDNAALPDLTGAERLFAEAWLKRREPKQPRGEGLNWGNKDFDAP
jgi:hypothetical protein